MGSKTRIPGSPGGGFTSTPRAGAPRFPGDPPPGEGWRLGLRRGPPGPSGTPGIPGARPNPAGNRGAPARGVDVKPPTRRCPGPGPGAPGRPLPPGGAGSQDPPDPGDGVPETPGSRRPGPWSPGPWEGSLPLVEGPAGVVLHQPLAAGPRGSRRSPVEASDATMRRGSPGRPGPRG